MAVGSNDGGVVNAIRVDLRRLHEGWMELLFPRQRSSNSSVLGKWKPTTTSERVTYRAWSVLGALMVAVAYPLALFGLAARYNVRRIDTTATRLGVLGVVVLSVVVWGALTVVARLNFSAEGFLAVGAAGLVATLAAALAVVFSSVGGRGTTVLVAYPLGVTAIFLPPVVAALYSPTVAETVFPKSETLAIWLLDNVLTFADLNDYLRSEYDLSGVGYVGMWFGIAVPLGWLLGLVVSLANVVRPSS